MTDTGFTLTVEEAKQHAADTGKIAKGVEQLLASDGWKIFTALYLLKRQEIHSKDDYPNIESFRGDRAALKIVEGLLDEMKGYIEDATAAAAVLQKVIASQAEDQTPTSILLAEQQGEESREG